MAIDPIPIAAEAARGFATLDCHECATNIRERLQSAGFGGEWLRIEGVVGLDYILCLSYDGGENTITENGKHYAIRVGDVVFDNLHPEGIHFDAWLADFVAVGGIRLASIEPF